MVWLRAPLEVRARDLSQVCEGVPLHFDAHRAERRIRYCEAEGEERRPGRIRDTPTRCAVHLITCQRSREISVEQSRHSHSGRHGSRHGQCNGCAYCGVSRWRLTVWEWMHLRVGAIRARLGNLCRCHVGDGAAEREERRSNASSGSWGESGGGGGKRGEAAREANAV